MNTLRKNNIKSAFKYSWPLYVISAVIISLVLYFIFSIVHRIPVYQTLTLFITGEVIEENNVEANVSLTIDAFIPSEYATDSDKIELYQEIMTASSTDSLIVLKKKTKDVYGTLPRSVELLFIKKNVDLLLAEAGVQSLKEQPNIIEIYLGEPYINIKGIGNILFETLIPYISKIKVSYLNHRFKVVLKKDKDWLKDLESILIGLENIKATNKIKEIR